MLLTADEQKAMARKAQWSFDCYFGLNTQDSVVFTGDGVEDLDNLIARLQFAVSNHGTGVNSRFQADVGTQYSVYRPFDIEDVRAVRSYYVAIYGVVDKPPVLGRGDLRGGTAGVSIT
jgi:hypothetical protein